MHLLYNIGIFLYGLSIQLAALFNPKAKQWIVGRKNIHIKPTDYWFHCASLGEFEQGRPIIEAIKAQYPSKRILLTFFSPSGYEVRKDYPLADQVCYLPLDTPKNAKKFIEAAQPQAAIFVKYEFWANYLLNLNKQGTKSYIISSIFRKEQHFFKWYGAWFRKVLQTVNHFFVQNQESKELLASIGITQCSISGDSRFDRVLQNAKQAKNIPLIEAFKGGKQLIVCGSTWAKDETLLLNITKDFPEVKWIFAPHEIKHSKKLAKQSKGLLLSEATENNIQGQSHLIIDNIGMLSSLYQYADVAYIGGGFGTGVHNILEAAAFGCPTLFGPNYHKFKEALELITIGGAKSIENSQNLKTDLQNFLANNKSDAISAYCQKQAGATAIITTQIAGKKAF